MSSIAFSVLSQADLDGHCRYDLFHFALAQFRKPFDFLGRVYVHRPLRRESAKRRIITERLNLREQRLLRLPPCLPLLSALGWSCFSGQ